MKAAEIPRMGVTSSGTFSTLTERESRAGKKRSPATANVQNQGVEKRVHPERSRRVRAAGVTLRRRLSKSFHRQRTGRVFRSFFP